jgi:EAL domain-containing protein (putative c-di-GMP-specific phosphodiesterase class I)
MEKYKQKYNDSSKGIISKICRMKNKIVKNLGNNRMVNSIQTGIARDEFTLFYQPEYNLESNEIIGVEALVRWISPEKGMIPPDAFIPLAEKTNIIYELERMIICKALEQKKLWEQEDLGHIELSINLSSRSIDSEDNFKIIEDIISSYKVNYKTIIFEITESVVIANIDLALERINRLRKYGIRFALDDFGTGYSSLTHLLKLPIDIIKIDKSFIRSIPYCSEETSITKNILTMAHDLRFKVVAEGIETLAQLEYLRKNSCEGGQGFLLCIPLSSERVVDVLKARASIVG